MEDDKKEVYFAQYCYRCKYYELEEHDEPCDECLAEPSNVNSHKPVKFVEKQ